MADQREVMGMGSPGHMRGGSGGRDQGVSGPLAAGTQASQPSLGKITDLDPSMH
jgi:hypothetical protein